jgi:serine/threonine-protein kinase HipA
MIRGNGASLAPMYDVMCGEVWESVTKNLAQKIAGKSRGDRLSGGDWQQFARECGLNPRQVLDRVQTLAKSAIAEAAAAASEVAAMPAGTHEVLGLTRQAVERRANLILAFLHDLGSEPHTDCPRENTKCFGSAIVPAPQPTLSTESGGMS